MSFVVDDIFSRSACLFITRPDLLVSVCSCLCLFASIRGCFVCRFEYFASSFCLFALLRVFFVVLHLVWVDVFHHLSRSELLGEQFKQRCFRLSCKCPRPPFSWKRLPRIHSEELPLLCCLLWGPPEWLRKDRGSSFLLPVSTTSFFRSRLTARGYAEATNVDELIHLSVSWTRHPWSCSSSPNPSVHPCSPADCK